VKAAYKNKAGLKMIKNAVAYVQQAMAGKFAERLMLALTFCSTFFVKKKVERRKNKKG
jgi:hypothetical protein